ncbi:MAG: hypothetical protein P8M07_09350 [Flavobacteriales bacterium]|nr:hypothetical protein [Flavobacteriales bacterium]
MKQLDKHWLTEGLLDVEYKQYILLAWLQKAKRQFRDVRLYPALAQLIDQHRHLNSLMEGRKNLDKSVKGDVIGLDFKKLRKVHKHMQDHPDLDRYLNELLALAEPLLRETIDEGTSLYELVESGLEFAPVGIQPIYQREGYLMVLDEPRKEVLSYRYHHSQIDTGKERMLRLDCRQVDRRRVGFSDTLEQIKLNLTRLIPELPHPAAFMVRANQSYPLEQTLLPVAKRRLLRELAA